MSPLSAWDNFYVIVGSSAGALTGLTFVVMSLMGNVEQRQPVGAVTAAFQSPTFVQFGVVLLLAAGLSAPWPSLSLLGVFLAAAGLGLLAYSAIVIRRLRTQSVYSPVLEDWTWYGIGPTVAYGGLVVAGVLLGGHPASMLFLVAAVMLLLLFIGLRNAWDLVTYIAIVRYEQPPQADNSPASGETND